MFKVEPAHLGVVLIIPDWDQACKKLSSLLKEQLQLLCIGMPKTWWWKWIQGWSFENALTKVNTDSHMRTFLKSYYIKFLKVILFFFLKVPNIIPGWWWKLQASPFWRQGSVQRSAILLGRSFQRGTWSPHSHVQVVCLTNPAVNQNELN